MPPSCFQINLSSDNANGRSAKGSNIIPTNWGRETPHLDLSLAAFMFHVYYCNNPFFMRVTNKDERFNSTRSHELCIPLDHFKNGCQLSMQREWVEILNFYRIVLAQILSNSMVSINTSSFFYGKKIWPRAWVFFLVSSWWRLIGMRLCNFQWPDWISTIWRIK